MAERKPIVIISGLLQELNVGTDNISLSGNSTTDLSEGTNLYFTNARARGAVSVTDSGGFGSLAYDSSTGVITYTGPSNSDVRGTLSVASGNGLTYNASTGEFGTSAIPNSQLANDDVTIGSTAVALGATASTIAGLTSLASTTLISGIADAANAISIASGNITFEGSTADTNETILTAADATGGDKTLTLPNETGTILSTASSIANSNLANSSIVLGSATVNLGDTVSGLSLTNIQATTKLQVGAEGGAGNIVLHADTSGGFSRGITFEGATGGADANETLLAVTDPTADRTITLPDATGTVALLSTLSVASASGLTYNSSTGEFSTNAIPNSKLANSSVTVGTTGIALGGSATTIAGLTSITSDAVVTNDDGFRIRDNSDNTKQVAFECSGITGSTTRTLTIPDASGTIALVGGGTTVFADDVFRVTDNSDASKKLAFECSGISGSTTRTMTVPNENGTISTESFATAIAVALG